MSIPKNILRGHVISAIEHINESGIPSNRGASNYSLIYDNKAYPPKYVLSIANLYANGVELQPTEFHGGDQTNSFLMQLGFVIVEQTDENKSDFKFLVGHYYSRKDVYRIVNVPEHQQGGNWDTGYTRFKGDSFIFANVGTAGRTGHDHPNQFDGDDLIWYGKDGSKLSHSSIKSLINPHPYSVYIFVREDSKNPHFLYLGKGKAVEFEDSALGKVKIRWTFND